MPYDSLRHACLCDAVRTPFGCRGGRLAPVRDDDLAAIPPGALIGRNPNLDWSRPGDGVRAYAPVGRVDGAIASGHPPGASGARLITPAVNHLSRGNGRFAPWTMRIGAGQGIATAPERV